MGCFICDVHSLRATQLLNRLCCNGGSIALRLVATAITKMLRTSSTEAVLVLADLLPVDLRAKQLAASHSLKTNWPITTFVKSHVAYAKKLIPDADLPGNLNDKLGVAFGAHLPLWTPFNFLLNQTKP